MKITQVYTNGWNKLKSKLNKKTKTIRVLVQLVSSSSVTLTKHLAVAIRVTDGEYNCVDWSTLLCRRQYDIGILAWFSKSSAFWSVLILIIQRGRKFGILLNFVEWASSALFTYRHLDGQKINHIWCSKSSQRLWSNRVVVAKRQGNWLKMQLGSWNTCDVHCSTVSKTRLAKFLQGQKLITPNFCSCGFLSFKKIYLFRAK